ncbi:MAG: hypothetical protein L0Y44_10555, partial [Phycisphaerales bacterium]|nr:hypothetical protein [Phycisphaerales bacterium]
MNRLVFVLVTLNGTASVGTVCGQSTFQGLGMLPSANNSVALGVSSDGQVVVGASGVFGTEEYRGFRWTADGGLQEVPPLGSFTTLYGATADGGVLIGTHAQGMCPDFQMGFAFGDGSLIWLQPLSGHARSWADGISADGAFVVGSSWEACPSSSNHKAVRWSVSVVEDLGMLANGIAAQATDVSADGSVVVGHCDTNA